MIFGVAALTLRLSIKNNPSHNGFTQSFFGDARKDIQANCLSICCINEQKTYG